MEQPGCDVRCFFACGPLPFGEAPAEVRLALPIVLFSSRQEPLLNATLIESWGTLTTAELSINLLPGDRSCLLQRGNHRSMLDEIGRRLAGELRSRRSNGRGHAGRQRSTTAPRP
jgi:hypothetical protein